jgi:thiamine biosynthesis lipoprotein ApbE
MNHKRLHTRLLALLLCCALVLPLSACGEDKSTTQQIFAMDTVMDLTAYGKKADDGINAAISIINSMDTLLDPENERSKTYEINHAMGGSVVVNEQIAKMLRTAQTVYERSDGALDLTTYPLSKLWGFIDQNYRVPSDAEIERLLPCVDMSKVQLSSTDDSANSLVTMPADMSLSFGAVAKGCASDYAIQAMRAAGVTSGVVSLGGNVQTLGKKPDGSDWNIAVQDKSKFDKADAKRKIEGWLKLNYCYLMGGLDVQYIHIKPRIIAEKFIENDGGDLYDYKIFCFNGEPKIILHIEERYTDKEERMFFLDTDWNQLPFNINVPLELDADLPRPANLEKMLDIARTLSQGYTAVRVDLYSLNDGSIKFGEMTFTTESGISRWHPESANEYMGSLIHLPGVDD